MSETDADGDREQRSGYGFAAHQELARVYPNLARELRPLLLVEPSGPQEVAVQEAAPVRTPTLMELAAEAGARRRGKRARRKLARCAGWIASPLAHAALLLVLFLAGLQVEGLPGKIEGVLELDFSPEAQEELPAPKRSSDVFNMTSSDRDTDAAAVEEPVAMPGLMPEPLLQEEHEKIRGPENPDRADPLPALTAPEETLIDALLLSSPEDLKLRGDAPTSIGTAADRHTSAGPYRPVVAVRIDPSGQDGDGGSSGHMGMTGDGMGQMARQPAEASVARSLQRHWERYINRQVDLPKPSGWHFHYPWFISSPAVADLTPSPGLEVVTGTEEGVYEYFPLGQGQGRYVCTGADGRILWEYRTDNNAGRASPAIAELRGDGRLCVLGGSTSGWMVHCFEGVTGRRIWRHEVDGKKANILAPPAAADFRSDLPGLETVAVALNGRVVAVDARGRRLWDDLPFGEAIWAPNSAAPVLEDIDGDGRIEAVTVLAGMVRNSSAVRVKVYDAASGKERWSQDFWPMLNLGEGGDAPPLPSPVVVRPGLRAPAARGDPPGGLIVLGFTNSLVVLDARGSGQRWRLDRPGIFSGAAVGDLDGDGLPELVASAGRELLALRLETGKEIWRRELIADEEKVPVPYRGRRPPALLSAPVLARRAQGAAGRIEWGMFGANPGRTGCAETSGPHEVYVAGCDGSVHIVSGRYGWTLGRQTTAVPDLFISSQKVGSLPYVSSPAVADIDGDGVLEVLVTMVDRLWCLKDSGSSSPGTDFECAVQMAARETRPLILLLEPQASRRPGLLEDGGVRRAAVRSGVAALRVWPPVAPAAERSDADEGRREAWKRYDQAAARYVERLKAWGVTYLPALVCLAPGGRCVGRVETPSREQAIELINGLPKMIEAAARSAAR